MLLGSLSSGCALTGDPEQARSVDETMSGLPDDIVRAPHAGKVRKHYEGPTGENVSADRNVKLTVGPVPPTTAGHWVAGCRAAIPVLASTSGRLYGRLPGDDRVYEGTDLLRERGLEAPGPIYEAESRLYVGLPQADGRVLDTGVELAVVERTLVTSGLQEHKKGDVITVSKAVPAELDGAITATALPWRNPAGRAGRRHPWRWADQLGAGGAGGAAPGEPLTARGRGDPQARDGFLREFDWLIAALDDPLAPYPFAAKAAARIPRARLVTVERGGHLFLGQDAQIRDEIAAFVASILPENPGSRAATWDRPGIGSSVRSPQR
jgi:hypothetical protein